MIDIESDEVIDLIYTRIYQFLQSKVGKDLNQNLIDIDLETASNGEIIVNIELYLELSPFSDHDVKKIAEEAIRHGITTADQIMPDLVVKIHKMVI